MRRRILLAVTGLTPQVITETLYALTQLTRPAFVPTEIYLLTTQKGAALARRQLLTPGTGWFHRLCREYDLPAMRFTSARIEAVRRPDGRPMDDIRTPEDNLAMANAILRRVRQCTALPDSALHVSMAGGRKTMGFYAGYALSLLGRPQDRLSHVLVDAAGETNSEFFYPPRRPARPARRGPQVMLAEVPVVFLRQGIPPGLLHGHESFDQTVAAINQAGADASLRLDLEGRRIH